MSLEEAPEVFSWLSGGRRLATALCEHGHRLIPGAPKLLAVLRTRCRRPTCAPKREQLVNTVVRPGTGRTCGLKSPMLYSVETREGDDHPMTSGAITPRTATTARAGRGRPFRWGG